MQIFGLGAKLFLPLAGHGAAVKVPMSNDNPVRAMRHMYVS